MPPADKDDLTDRITIRCTGAQRELWEKASEQNRRRLADWIRLSLDDVAKAQVGGPASGNAQKAHRTR